jgi:hypothetical protein
MTETVTPAKPKTKKRKKAAPKPKQSFLKKAAVTTGTTIWNHIKGYITIQTVVAFAAGAYFL